MDYKITIEKLAVKFIKKQTKQEQKRLYTAIESLPCGDVKSIQGFKGFYRLRVGDFRIIYKIDNDKYIICVVDAGNRGQIYKKY